MCTVVIFGLVVFFLMRLRPPKSTRTDTRLPYTTLFLAAVAGLAQPLLLGLADVDPELDLVGQAAPPEVGLVHLFHRVGERQWRLVVVARSEEHTSELQSLMRISYAVFCLKKKNNRYNNQTSRVHKSHEHKLSI